MNIFIGCGKQKNDKPCEAKDMYTSFFSKQKYLYAKNLGADNIYILSAKYGLLKDSEKIEPYDKTLNKMKKKEKQEWYDMVYQQMLKEGINFTDKSIFLCGKEYYAGLIEHFTNNELPLLHKGLGEQVSFLIKENNKYE